MDYHKLTIDRLREMRGDTPRLAADDIPTALDHWKANLSRAVEQEPDRWAPMLYRPPVDSSAVLVRIHAKFPAMVDRTLAALNGADEAFQDFLDGRPNAANDLLTAVESLLDKVGVLSDAFDNSEILPRLTDTDRCILQAMLSMGAMNGTLASGRDIIQQATGGTTFKKNFENVKSLRLVNVAKGRGGGYSLSDRGAKVAAAMSV